MKMDGGSPIKTGRSTAAAENQPDVRILTGRMTAMLGELEDGGDSDDEGAEREREGDGLENNGMDMSARGGPDDSGTDEGSGSDGEYHGVGQAGGHGADDSGSEEGTDLEAEDGEGEAGGGGDNGRAVALAMGMKMMGEADDDFGQTPPRRIKHDGSNALGDAIADGEDVIPLRSWSGRKRYEPFWAADLEAMPVHDESAEMPTPVGSVASDRRQAQPPAQQQQRRQLSNNDNESQKSHTSINSDPHAEEQEYDEDESYDDQAGGGGDDFLGGSGRHQSQRRPLQQQSMSNANAMAGSTPQEHSGRKRAAGRRRPQEQEEVELRDDEYDEFDREPAEESNAEARHRQMLEKLGAKNRKAKEEAASRAARREARRRKKNQVLGERARMRMVVGAADDGTAPAFLAPTKAAELQRVKVGMGDGGGWWGGATATYPLTLPLVTPLAHQMEEEQQLTPEEQAAQEAAKYERMVKVRKKFKMQQKKL